MKELTPQQNFEAAIEQIKAFWLSNVFADLTTDYLRLEGKREMITDFHSTGADWSLFTQLQIEALTNYYLIVRQMWAARLADRAELLDKTLTDITKTLEIAPKWPI